MNLKNLPLRFRKVNKHFFKDTKTGQMIHLSKIESYCLVEPEIAIQSEELKQELIMSQRWDLNKD